MLALLLLVLQGVAAPQVEVPPPPWQLLSGYESQLIRSTSGRVELAYSVSSRTGAPIVLTVLVEQKLLWQRTIEAPLEFATVDERGWVAGFRWTRPQSPPCDHRLGTRFGELRVYDARGTLVTRRSALSDSGWGCMSMGTTAVDVVFLADQRILLRADQCAEGEFSQHHECWSVYDSRDLSVVARWSPALALGRPSTPLWLPPEWDREGEPALDVGVIAGAPLVAVRWPFPNWRSADGGVELQEDFSVAAFHGAKLADLAHSASPVRAEPDPEFNLALPRCREWRRDEWFRSLGSGHFALVRALDGAWIEYRAVADQGSWRIERAP
jgi:hypothetical protein